jgi:cell wall-associated NlpC family hydrolase
MLAFVVGCGASSKHAPVSVSGWTAAAPQLPALLPAPTVKPVTYLSRSRPRRRVAAQGRRLGRPDGGHVERRNRGGAPSDAEVERELQAAYGGKASPVRQVTRRPCRAERRAGDDPADRASRVAAVIAAANQVASYPYVYGGGHGTFEDNAYDCSGSLSFAFAAAGMLHTTLVSGEFAHWGAAGPGKWITIYANATHTWMTVAGLRYDTGGLRTPTHSRWQDTMRPTAGFVVRHPIGL